MVKNESHFTVIKTATTEMQKNEEEIRENQSLIEQLKSLTKSQEITILEYESKIKRLEKNIAHNDLPIIEDYDADISPPYLRPENSFSRIGIANNLRSSIKFNKQRTMARSLYSDNNLSAQQRSSFLKRESTI